ncbi:AlbA family DNA-binding domain-containing protein [Streptomyces sp. 900105245]
MVTWAGGACRRFREAAGPEMVRWAPAGPCLRCTGNLFVGVGDDGTVLGIENDLSTLPKQADPDGYELFVRQVLDDNLSAPTATTVRISFPEVAGRVVCRVSVAAAGKAVFARPAKGGSAATDFWVRAGNATNQLHGEGLLRYREEHWG